MKPIFILLILTLVAGTFASPSWYNNQYFRFTSPIGARTWDTGSTQEITFTSNKLTFNVRVDLYQLKGGYYHFIVLIKESVSIGTGVATFNVPSDLAGNNYYVRVTGDHLRVYTGPITIKKVGGNNFLEGDEDKHDDHYKPTEYEHEDDDDHYKPTPTEYDHEDHDDTEYEHEDHDDHYKPTPTEYEHKDHDDHYKPMPTEYEHEDHDDHYKPTPTPTEYEHEDHEDHDDHYEPTPTEYEHEDHDDRIYVGDYDPTAYTPTPTIEHEHDNEIGPAPTEFGNFDYDYKPPATEYEPTPTAYEHNDHY